MAQALWVYERVEIPGSRHQTPSGSVEQNVYSDTLPSETPVDVDSDTSTPMGGDIELLPHDEMTEDVSGVVDMVAGADVVGHPPRGVGDKTVVENEAWRTKRFDEITETTKVSGEDTMRFMRHVLSKLLLL